MTTRIYLHDIAAGALFSYCLGACSPPAWLALLLVVALAVGMTERGRQA